MPSLEFTGQIIRKQSGVYFTADRTLFLFFMVLSGIEDEAEKGGYRVIICQSNENYEKEVKGAQALLEARVCRCLGFCR